MRSRAVLTRWSWLIAVVMTLGLAACSSDDDSDNGERDVQVDRGTDVGQDTGQPDTGQPDTGQPDTGQPDTGLPDTGGDLCSQIGAAENVGSACDAEATDPQCGQGGICAALGTASATCWQVCVPGVCDNLCTVAGEACLTVVDEDGNPIEIQPGVTLGVCAEAPTGTQGPYQRCGTQETGNCEEGLFCTAFQGISMDFFCVPECGPSDECPDLESVAGVCALQLTDPETSEVIDACALQCTPGDGAVCPTGMNCVAVTGGGICLWPES